MLMMRSTTAWTAAAVLVSIGGCIAIAIQEKIEKVKASKKKGS